MHPGGPRWPHPGQARGLQHQRQPPGGPQHQRQPPGGPRRRHQHLGHQHQEMVAAGVIGPSDSSWAGPAILVTRKDDTRRFFVDYRRLTTVTTKDSYPLPRIYDAVDYITGSRWFSSLDRGSSYWQVEVAAEAKDHVYDRARAVAVQGHATLEGWIGCWQLMCVCDRCVVYLDDLLVHASSFEGAMANLRGGFAVIHDRPERGPQSGCPGAG